MVTSSELAGELEKTDCGACKARESLAIKVVIAFHKLRVPQNEGGLVEYCGHRVCKWRTPSLFSVRLAVRVSVVHVLTVRTRMRKSFQAFLALKRLD